MVSQDDFVKMMKGIEALTQALTQQETADGGGGGTPPGEGRRGRPPSRIIDDRHLKIQDFSGNAEDWADWAFTFKRVIRSRSMAAYKLMCAMEVKDEEVEEELDLDKDGEQISGELYDMLCQTCLGEAKSTIRNVDDMQGIKAWQSLHRKYNPKTAARMVRMLGEVTSPMKLKELKDVENALNQWEEKVKMLERESSECACVFKDPVKIAIVTHMMPLSVQEYIYTNLTKDASYKGITDKIKVLVGNKIAMNAGGAIPMDIGMVDGGGRKDEVWQDDALIFGGDGDGDVNAVSMGLQCHNCNGWGHMQRDCPTKGKGKDARGGSMFGGGPKGGKNIGGKAFRGPPWQGGKGGGKSSGQQWNPGKGGNGKGVGYQGTCFNCGQIGHKRWECPNARQANAVEELMVQQMAEVNEIGGLWMIGAVEVVESKGDDEFEVVEKKRNKKNKNVADKTSKVEVLTDRCAIPIQTLEVKAERLTRHSGMVFHEANVRKPLASAVKVTKAGNKIVMEEDGGYIENRETGERMKVRIQDDTYVYDVQMEDGNMVTVTLDSGAGCNVWPRGLAAGLEPLMAKKPSMRMVAANGSEIENFGQRVVKFRCIEAPRMGSAEVFSRRT